jgi:hypothetical protein
LITELCYNVDMELYVKTVNTVTFDLPTDDTIVTGASYSLNGGPSKSLVVDGNAVTLPYFQTEGDLAVKWNIIIPGSGPFVEIQDYSLVTPYLSKAQIKKIWPEATDEDVVDIETMVRRVINAHTGQSFGHSVKAVTVEGHGELMLKLPQRLIALNGLSTLTQVIDPNCAIIVSDGWYLKKNWGSVLSTMTNPSLYWSGFWAINNAEPNEPGYEQASHGEVIEAPSTLPKPTEWKDDYPFTIAGEWGYKSVPEDVKAAAALLVNEYACGEVGYRDKYLKAMKAADWDIDFSSRSWEATGNVRADQLLSDFVIFDWALI